MIGPKDEWQAELDKVSRSGLIELAYGYFAVLSAWPVHMDRAEKLRMVKAAREDGKYIDAMKRLDRYRSEPFRFLEERLSRRESAKKAANRRKRERKAKMKEAR